MRNGQTKPVAVNVDLNSIDFKNVHLWDNHDPYLYQLLVKIRDEQGQLVELVPYRFGFRRIEISDDHVVFLNDKRLIINGVNQHEWDDHRGRAITMEDMEKDIATFKENNINAVRTCHYPDQIPWYYLCDQNGIYMMAENNLESHATWQKMGGHRAILQCSRISSAVDGSCGRPGPEQLRELQEPHGDPLLVAGERIL